MNFLQKQVVVVLFSIEMNNISMITNNSSLPWTESDYKILCPWMTQYTQTALVSLHFPLTFSSFFRTLVREKETQIEKQKDISTGATICIWRRYTIFRFKDNTERKCPTNRLQVNQLLRCLILLWVIWIGLKTNSVAAWRRKIEKDKNVLPAKCQICRDPAVGYHYDVSCPLRFELQNELNEIYRWHLVMAAKRSFEGLLLLERL